MSENLLAVYKGLVAEQFIGQQLFALGKCFAEPELYYWQREVRGQRGRNRLFMAKRRRYSAG
jgi:hypothetical protein